MHKPCCCLVHMEAFIFTSMHTREMDTTTIPIDESVRDRLKRCGAEDESFNSIIERLLDLYEEFDLEQYIEKQYQKLEKDKEKFVSLEQYEDQRR